MQSLELVIDIGFVFSLSLVVESKTTVNKTRTEKTVLLGKNVRPKSGVVAYSYPTPILLSDQCRRYRYKEYDKRWDLYYKFHPIFAFELKNFLSYAAHFCKYETENGTLEVVSVGSGDGTIENNIIAAYANFFGGQLNITLIDPNPAYRVHFPTVDDLVAKRANAVRRNCILLIIYPFDPSQNNGYDIEAIRKLQPRAVLAMYEITGNSGSLEFLACLHPPGYKYAEGKKCRRRLNNYEIEEIAYQEVKWDPRLLEKWSREDAFKFRLIKLQRTD